MIDIITYRSCIGSLFCSRKRVRCRETSFHLLSCIVRFVTGIECCYYILYFYYIIYITILMIGTLLDSENSLSVLNNHRILNSYLSSYNNLHVRNMLVIMLSKLMILGTNNLKHRQKHFSKFCRLNLPRINSESSSRIKVFLATTIPLTKFLSLWICMINLALITIINPGILNPGPENSLNTAHLERIMYSLYTIRTSKDLFLSDIYLIKTHSLISIKFMSFKHMLMPINQTLSSLRKLGWKILLMITKFYLVNTTKFLDVIERLILTLQILMILKNSERMEEGL